MIPRALLVAGVVVSGFAQIAPERILNADREPGNWLTYSRAYDGQRYSPLAEITAANVGRLKAAWTYQIGQPGKFSTSPIVVDGILYITEPGGIVLNMRRDGRDALTAVRAAA